METKKLPPSEQLIAGKKFSELSPETLAEYERLMRQEIEAELEEALSPLLKAHGLSNGTGKKKDESK